MTKVVGDNTAVLTHSSKYFTVIIISFNSTAILKYIISLPISEMVKIRQREELIVDPNP